MQMQLYMCCFLFCSACSLAGIPPNTMANASVYDTGGKLVAGKILTADNMLNVAGFAPGTYFIRITVGAKSVCRKFVKL